VLAEEDRRGGQTMPAEERLRVWVVDPIDGTNEFLDPGGREFCSVVALVEDGYPVAALIVAPELGADRGPLILTVDTRIRCVLANGVAPAVAPLTRLVSASRSSTSPPGAVERKCSELGLVVKVRATSQTLDMVRAIIDLEPLTGLRSFRCFAADQQLLWDAAAGIATAAARGRVVVDGGGQALCPFEPSLLTVREPRLPSVILAHEADLAWLMPI